jgi:integrase
VLRAALSQAARWGWVSTNVAAPATIGRRMVAPRSAMAAAEVRAVIEAAGRLDPAAGVAFRLAAITGARRAELCALVRADLEGDRLTIDSSIAIERSGSIAHRQHPTLIDSATKTGNWRAVRLDGQTIAAIEDLWSLSKWWGPWLLTPSSDRSTRSA